SDRATEGVRCISGRKTRRTPSVSSVPDYSFQTVVARASRPCVFSVAAGILPVSLNISHAGAAGTKRSAPVLGRPRAQQRTPATRVGEVPGARTCGGRCGRDDNPFPHLPGETAWPRNGLEGLPRNRVACLAEKAAATFLCPGGTS